jgi:Icc-related predicted phosphoesterase
MRLAYAADLHGNVALYRALLDLAVVSGAQAVVVGGDLLPHEPRADRAVHSQRSFIEREIRPLLERFHSAHPAVDVFLLAGNDDWAAAIAGLADLEMDRLAYALHGRTFGLSQPGLWVAGYACVPPTPFSMKDYERPDAGSRRAAGFGRAYISNATGLVPLEEWQFYERPQIATELAELALLSDPARTIYVCHTPPADTPLDLMAGQRHVGSQGLRSFIEQHQPPLTLHGHIHEAPALSGTYACQIGSTWCINPGRDPQRLHAVTFDSDDITGTLNHTIYSSF